MKRNVVGLTAALLLGTLVLWGCSSSPSKDELKQLETTQAEIASLAQKSNALKMEEASLQQSISEKQAKLKSCQDDKTAVETKLKSVQ